MLASQVSGEGNLFLNVWLQAPFCLALNLHVKSVTGSIDLKTEHHAFSLISPVVSGITWIISPFYLSFAVAKTVVHFCLHWQWKRAALYWPILWSDCLLTQCLTCSKKTTYLKMQYRTMFWMFPMVRCSRTKFDQSECPWSANCYVSSNILGYKND